MGLKYKDLNGWTILQKHWGFSYVLHVGSGKDLNVAPHFLGPTDRTHEGRPQKRWENRVESVTLVHKKDQMNHGTKGANQKNTG